MFEPNCVIVLIAPEISIKSPTVRSFMVTKLKKNILLYLRHFNLKTESMYYVSGRLIIPTLQPKEVASALSTCFGIFDLYLAESFKFDSMKMLCDKVGKIVEGNFNDETFAIRGKSFSKEFSSKELEMELGGVVLDIFPKMKVKLKDPEKEIFCITQKDKAFVYFDRMPAAGGMPVSVQGKAAVLCSKNTNKNDLILLGKNLMKCGASIILVSNDDVEFDLSELEKHSAFLEIKTIPVDLAKGYIKKGGVRAFFSCARTAVQANRDSELAGEKVFAPLLF